MTLSFVLSSSQYTLTLWTKKFVISWHCYLPWDKQFGIIVMGVSYEQFVLLMNKAIIHTARTSVLWRVNVSCYFKYLINLLRKLLGKHRWLTGTGRFFIFCQEWTFCINFVFDRCLSPSQRCHSSPTVSNDSSLHSYRLWNFLSLLRSLCTFYSIHQHLQNGKCTSLNAQISPLKYLFKKFIINEV